MNNEIKHNKLLCDIGVEKVIPLQLLDLQTRIDKAIEYIESCLINPEDLSFYGNMTEEEYIKLLEILRGEE